MRRIVVVGGGISGLAAAWSACTAARAAGLRLEVVVLERDSDVGGKARTTTRDGWLVEEGPSGFVTGRPELDALVHAAGMTGEMVAATPAARRRFLYLRGSIREVRASPLALVRAGVIGVGGALRMLGEPLVPRAPSSGPDETVWGFVARRAGRQVADRLAAPICLGVFAGDAARLSLTAAFPGAAALEREHGSVLRGLIARRGRMTNGAPASFRDGMQSLPRALASRGGFVVRCGSTVRAVRHTAGGWVVSTAHDSLNAAAVVLAVEPWMAAQLIAPLHAAAGGALAGIPCPPIAVVGLGFAPGTGPRTPAGFGVLVARHEGFRMLGNLWESSVYPGRAPRGGLLIRVMLGGAVDERIGAMSDGDTEALAREEVRRLYRSDARPALVHVARVPRGIPQYETGHARRVAVVEAAERALPGLAVTGFGLRGVAFADAAADGCRAGDRTVAALVMRPGTAAPRPPGVPVTP